MASDPTFRSYKPAQAHLYAAGRRGYPPALYEHIFAEHAASGGRFGVVLDVGCGPGSATRDLAPAFEHAVGVDPGEQMINVARERGGMTSKGEQIVYELCDAERCADAPGMPVGMVDLITVATAAHWFDMKQFWAQAAQLLRPGGTVAIWVSGMQYADPSMQYAVKANEVQDAFLGVIEPYFQPGNLIAHELYDGLELPWAADTAQTAFPKDKFRRFEWDRDGVLSDGVDFFGGSSEYTLEAYEQGMSTVSAVTRWREAHPELVGTEHDCVKMAVTQMREVVGSNSMRGGSSKALLIFKRGE